MLRERLQARISGTESQILVSSRPNFRASPGKKGTYGYPGLLFADNPEWRHTLEWMPETNHQIQRRRSQDDMERRPFVSLTRPVECFASNTATYGSSHGVPPTDPAKKKRPASAKPSRVEHMHDWKPSNPVRKDKCRGFPKHMSFHPNFKQRPQSATARLQERQEKEEKEKERPMWMPSSKPGSYITKAVALNHRNIGWNC